MKSSIEVDLEGLSSSRRPRIFSFLLAFDRYGISHLVDLTGDGLGNRYERKWVLHRIDKTVHKDS
jgi:hypothetical protein